MKRLAAAAILVGVMAGEARADLGETFLAIGYVVSIGGGALCTAVNGSYLSFGEPAPRGWRLAGFVAGGVDVAWGVAAYAAASDRSEGVVVGSIAVAVGAASFLTALFVDESDDRPGVRVVGWAAPEAAGVGVVGRF